MLRIPIFVQIRKSIQSVSVPFLVSISVAAAEFRSRVPYGPVAGFAVHERACRKAKKHNTHTQKKKISKTSISRFKDSRRRAVVLKTLQAYVGWECGDRWVRVDRRSSSCMHLCFGRCFKGTPGRVRACDIAWMCISSFKLWRSVSLSDSCSLCASAWVCARETLPWPLTLNAYWKKHMWA